MIRPAASILIGCLPLVAAAQDADRVRSAAKQTASAVEASTGCRIALQGIPEFDPSSGKWLVAYTASGNGCDAASEALRGAGPPSGLLFYRRPTRAQVDVLVAGMLRSVQSAFACRIMVTGAPRFHEGSGHWSVSFRASGVDCDGAEEELRRQGDSLEIYFQPVLDRRDLIQGGIPSLP